MTRNTLATIPLLLALGFTAACGGSSETSTALTDDRAKTNAVALVPGSTVDTVVREAKAGEPALVVVKLKLSNGAVLEVEYVAADGSLFEVKSDTAPFEGYDFTPRAGALKYAQAKAKALEAKAGAVEVWEFAATKSIWEFYVRDSAMHLWEIKMGASDGKIVSVVEKVKAD